MNYDSTICGGILFGVVFALVVVRLLFRDKRMSWLDVLAVAVVSSIVALKAILILRG